MNKKSAMNKKYKTAITYRAAPREGAPDPIAEAISPRAHHPLVEFLMGRHRDQGFVDADHNSFGFVTDEAISPHALALCGLLAASVEILTADDDLLTAVLLDAAGVISLKGMIRREEGHGVSDWRTCVDRAFACRKMWDRPGLPFLDRVALLCDFFPGNRGTIAG